MQWLPWVVKNFAGKVREGRIVRIEIHEPIKQKWRREGEDDWRHS